MEKPKFHDHFIAILALPFISAAMIPYLIMRYIPQKNDFGMVDDAVIFAFRFFGASFFITGIAILAYCIVQLHRYGKGTLAPWYPTIKLVEAPPYSYVRNPMLLGVMIVLLGESFFFVSFYLVIWCLLFWLGNTVYLAWIEEPSLYKRFGDAYLSYLHQVPRWIPKFKLGKQNG